MTKIAWANEMVKLAEHEIHPDWLLKRYENQIRAVVSNGGNQYDNDCREIFRCFAVMVMLNQLHEGFLPDDFEWYPELPAEEYLDFRAAVAQQKKKATNT